MLKNYRLKRDLLNDLIAGVTSGIMMIPQGMAFALLASLPPITGLYVCLFASLTYFLLGTSHHVSWGPIAVLSIMIGSVLDTFESRAFPKSETPPALCLSAWRRTLRSPRRQRLSSRHRRTFFRCSPTRANFLRCSRT
ncbi:hypothetical protein C0Q70_09034 [Pomacea canaliculata]|uniref:SLC26A/SulP transporter domain-containing protein n=1 Tax=Pomacea canaliculata TaxID=400727 RepID=A0A2T7P8M5_POMCA|nr:hypothetical protein C0Q70_09034 [Pomacea canaliculata]